GGSLVSILLNDTAGIVDSCTIIDGSSVAQLIGIEVNSGTATIRNNTVSSQLNGVVGSSQGISGAAVVNAIIIGNVVENYTTNYNPPAGSNTPIITWHIYGS